MKTRIKYPAYVLIGLTILFNACTSIRTLVGERVSPREEYARGLEKSELNTTAMVRLWTEAGDLELHDSVLVTLPFRETGFLASSEPQARFYQFDVKEGQVLTLTSVIKAKKGSRLFIDLFSREENVWKKLEHADSTLTLTHEFEKSGSCLVRLQPELLVNIYYSITLSVTPVLVNPVKGASNKSIGSFYGDPRDGGKRKHEGVDIFAPKGTPVVAPTDGVVTRVSNSTLGGKTVWMNDLKRGHSYYFAHLDSQIVRQGAKVKQGDILGTVGNTGNAQNTPSHLHFGVYQKNSKDPVTYIRTMEKLVNEMMPDTLFRSIVFRVKKNNTAIYAGPARKAALRQPVAIDTWVRVIAQSNDWFRVITADNREGFIEKNAVMPANKGKQFVTTKEVTLLSEASADAIPLGVITGTAEGLASYKNFRFVMTPDGTTGWIDLAAL